MSTDLITPVKTFEPMIVINAAYYVLNNIISKLHLNDYYAVKHIS